eukprot:scaffold135358_cov37-Prasinocladus_malaysianus.AAC.1
MCLPKLRQIVFKLSGGIALRQLMRDALHALSSSYQNRLNDAFDKAVTVLLAEKAAALILDGGETALDSLPQPLHLQHPCLQVTYATSAVEEGSMYSISSQLQAYPVSTPPMSLLDWFLKVLSAQGYGLAAQLLIEFNKRIRGDQRGAAGGCPRLGRLQGIG